MDADEIVRIIEFVSASKSKAATIQSLGVPKSTYYIWLKKYRTLGRAGITFPDKGWTEVEDNKLKALSSQGLTVAEISSEFPKRTNKAVASRIESFGISLLAQRRRYRERHGKLCSVCHEVKPLDQFYTASYESVDGRMSLCKDCFLADNRLYRLQNQEKILARSREYRERLKREDPQKFVQYRIDYRKTARGAFMTLKQRCQSNPNRKVSFQLKWDSFQAWYGRQEQSCVYCGITLEDYIQLQEHLPGVASTVHSLTIDRKDSSKPYIESNIVLSCYLCNYLKGYFFSFEDFCEIGPEYVTTYYDSLLA
jgi:hypothetical protein